MGEERTSDLLSQKFKQLMKKFKEPIAKFIQRPQESGELQEQSQELPQISSEPLPSTSKPSEPDDTKPKNIVFHKVYCGTVISIERHKCFVRVEGEYYSELGIIHILQLSHKHFKTVSEIVSIGREVKVKLEKCSENLLSFSMLDVDQETGEDLDPRSGSNLEDFESYDDDDTYFYETYSDRLSRLFSLSDLEDYTPALSTTSRFNRSEDESELSECKVYNTKNIKIELIKVRPSFLNKQRKALGDISPVKIIKNPNGSLAKAAIKQSLLVKEHKEQNMLQTETEEMISTPKNVNKSKKIIQMPWYKNTNLETDLQIADFLDWKKHIVGDKTCSFGKRSSLTIAEQRQILPIYKLKDDFIKAVKENQILIVTGETGSGKTTQMTQYLAEAGYTARGMIVGCTQPTCDSTISVAKRVAEEFGCRLGQKVGCTIRFADCSSRITVIKYISESMLLKECLIDQEWEGHCYLTDYSVIILDEAQERTVDTDVLCGILKQVVQRRPDFKLIVTSATSDVVKFSQYFSDAPIFTIPEKTYDVEIMYSKEPEMDYLDAALKTIMQIHLHEPPGDILVFVTDQEEIDIVCKILYKQMKLLSSNISELIILPVYSALYSDIQSRIFEPAPAGSRKIVITTNIAETGIAIDGIYYVVDPGFVKQKVYDTKIGANSLIVTPISQAAAKQRASRAGKTGPGKCYRLYTESAYRDEMLPITVPEIQRTNLVNTVIQLKAMNINDLSHFDFMDAPPVENLIAALDSLYGLNVLYDDGYITNLGKEMVQFPLKLNLAKMLVMSNSLQCSDAMFIIVSMLCVESIFYKPKDKQILAAQKQRKFCQTESDYLTLLAVYKCWIDNNYSDAWCRENFIQIESLKQAQAIRKHLISILNQKGYRVITKCTNISRLQNAICTAFFKNAARKDPKEGYRTLVGDQVLYIHPSSALFRSQPEWVVYHELDQTSKKYMISATTIEPQWLVECSSTFFKYENPVQLSMNEQFFMSLHNKQKGLNGWQVSNNRNRRY